MRVTPHLRKNPAPSSSVPKRSSPRTNDSDTVGRYLHGTTKRVSAQFRPGNACYKGSPNNSGCITPQPRYKPTDVYSYSRLPCIGRRAKHATSTDIIRRFQGALQATKARQQIGLLSTHALIIRRSASTRVVCRSFCMMCCPRLGVFSYKEKNRW